MVTLKQDLGIVTPEEEEAWRLKAEGKPKQLNDPALSPDHYRTGGIETIDYIKAKLTPDQLRGYYLGNLLKYLSRAQHKDGVRDFKKAEVYLKWLIDLEEQETQKK